MIPTQREQALIEAHPTPWTVIQGASKWFWIEDAHGRLVFDNNNRIDEATADLIVEAVNSREKAKEYVKAMRPLAAVNAEQAPPPADVAELVKPLCEVHMAMLAVDQESPWHRTQLAEATSTLLTAIRNINSALLRIARERDKARKALEPLAKAADWYFETRDDAQMVVWTLNNERLSVGDLRRARAALIQPTKEPTT